ncbi:hypothetical protein CF326_g519 [Tilletia indica]|nr:hypothetical protein CF326_g519 [Tilletia indica]
MTKRRGPDPALAAAVFCQGLASIPERGSHGAPRRFRGDADKLESFLEQVDKIIAAYGLKSDTEKVEALYSYFGSSVRELFRYQPSFIARDFSKMVCDLKTLYPSRKEYFRYDVSDLEDFVDRYRRKKKIDSLEDLAKYQRRFEIIGRWLLGRQKLDQARYDRLFWDGLSTKLQGLLKHSGSIYGLKVDLEAVPCAFDVLAALRKHFAYENFDADSRYKTPSESKESRSSFSSPCPSASPSSYSSSPPSSLSSSLPSPWSSTSSSSRLLSNPEGALTVQERRQSHSVRIRLAYEPKSPSISPLLSSPDDPGKMHNSKRSQEVEHPQSQSKRKPQIRSRLEAPPPPCPQVHTQPRVEERVVASAPPRIDVEATEDLIKQSLIFDVYSLYQLESSAFPSLPPAPDESPRFDLGEELEDDSISDAKESLETVQQEQAFNTHTCSPSPDSPIPPSPFPRTTLSPCPRFPTRQELVAPHSSRLALAARLVVVASLVLVARLFVVARLAFATRPASWLVVKPSRDLDINARPRTPLLASPAKSLSPTPEFSCGQVQSHARRSCIGDVSRFYQGALVLYHPAIT